MQLQQRLGRLERARPLQPRKEPAAQSIQAVIEQAGAPALVAIGERLANGTSTADDRAALEVLEPLCSGIKPEQVARTCWTMEQRI